MRQLAAYLMMTSRMERYLKQMVPSLRGGESTVVEDGLFGEWIGMGISSNDERLVQFLVAYEMVFQMPFGLWWHILHYGVVYLGTVALFDNLVHATERFGGLCKKYHATDRTVQPMNNATEYVPRLAVTLFDEHFDFISQTGVASLVALNNLSGQLVEGDKVIVLIEYLIGYRHTSSYCSEGMMVHIGDMPFLTLSCMPTSIVKCFGTKMSTREPNLINPISWFCFTLSPSLA